MLHEATQHMLHEATKKQDTVFAILQTSYPTL